MGGEPWKLLTCMVDLSLLFLSLSQRQGAEPLQVCAWEWAACHFLPANWAWALAVPSQLGFGGQ